MFGKNLHQLLMQPPIAGKVVLGWDPAFRTGCKLAVVDPTGKVIGTTVIYPTAPTTPQKIKASDASEDQGEQGTAQEDHTQVSYFAYLPRERHRIEGVGAVYRGTAQRNS